MKNIFLFWGNTLFQRNEEIYASVSASDNTGECASHYASISASAYASHQNDMGRTAQRGRRLMRKYSLFLGLPELALISGSGGAL
jgi:hypothetical protein